MTIITPAQIRKHFKCDVYVADKDYACPSFSWLRRTLFPKYRSFKKKHDLDYWKTSFDCDNHAVICFAMAQVFHHKQFAKYAEAVAVGEIWYNAKQGPHAINAAFIGKDKKLVFIEPQGPREITLTKKEQRSIWFARF